MTRGAPGAEPALAVPPWCEVEPGTGPVLLVAPHGGRRPVYDAAGAPLRRRVNDLYTPELTRRLATALGAGRIINHGLDRNAVDLNRLSDVRRHAPVFLAHIVEAIGAGIARHGAVEVVFVHGWNNGQAKCDIGIGGRDSGHGVTPADGASLTVTPDYLATRVASLQAACAATGIAAPIGEKYPAGHRNNLLQAFSQRFRASADPALRQLHDWSAAGRLNALQLELGIPLRWPGGVRDRFVRAAVAAFDARPGRRPALGLTPATTARPHARGATLQLYDPHTRVGVLAGMGGPGPGARAGRLVLFFDEQRVALFTGEEGCDPGLGVPPLHVERTADELTLAFDGPVLVLDDGRYYLDVEDAMARSRLANVRLEAHWRLVTATDHGPAFGRVDGAVAVDGRAVRLRTQGFCNLGVPGPAASAQHMAVAASFGEGLGLLARTNGGGLGFAVRFEPPHAEKLPLSDARIEVTADPFTPGRLTVPWGTNELVEAELRSRLAIVRPLANGAYARITFGVARCAWRGTTGWGLYEYGRVVSAAARISSGTAVPP